MEDNAIAVRRRKTIGLAVGPVRIGGGAPVSVQSMTKTDTRDVRATLAQIRRLERAGCEIVRLAVPDAEAAEALGRIKAGTGLPLIADIHFDHRLALACLAKGVDGLRINPGNIGGRQEGRGGRPGGPGAIRAHPDRGQLGLARKGPPGQRHGGATAAAMVESALRHIRILEDLDFRLIKVSLKASDVPRTVEAYRRLAEECRYPFHAGITEAGGAVGGAVKSAVGLGLLLARRPGRHHPGQPDRASGARSPRGLPDPGQPGPAAARGHGRLLPHVRPFGNGSWSGSRPGSRRPWPDCERPLTVAVMGCMVNGPGEAREADFGVACGRGTGVLFKAGRILAKVPEAEIVPALLRAVAGGKP